VAKAAGVNHATLLHHFPSKDALITGVLNMIETELAPTRDSIPNPDAVSALREEFVDATRRLLNEPEDFTVMLELLLAARHRADIAGPTTRQYANWRAEVSGIIQRGQDGGVFRRAVDAGEGADLITAYLTGLALVTLSGAASRPPSALADTAWQCIVSWLLVPPRPHGETRLSLD
jgi:AcrR family transcriptional regulator